MVRVAALLPVVMGVRCRPRRRPAHLPLLGRPDPGVSMVLLVAEVPVSGPLLLPLGQRRLLFQWASGGCTGSNRSSEGIVKFSRDPRW